MFEQCPGDEVEGVPVLGEEVAAPALLLGEDPLDLLVDHPGRLVAVVARRHQVVAEEHLVLAVPGHRSDLLAHAPFPDHLAGQFGGAHEVVAGAGGEHAEDHLFGDAASHAHHERVLDVVLPVEVALFLGKLHGHAEGHAARDDRDLVQRVGGGQHRGAERVAGLVVGDGLLFGVGERHRLAFLSHEDAVPGDLEVFGVDAVVAGSNGGQCCLVNQVGQVGSAHPRCSTGHHAQINVVVDLLALCVDLQDLPTILQFREWHDDLAVEAARA